MKKLYLIDGHALAYRMYYAFMKRPIMNSKGLDTSVLYGFTKTLMEIIIRERPTHLGVAFDPGGKNFRHDWYPDYKANRQPTPEVIITSLPLLKELIEAFNIPLLILSGYEADDVIGTIAKRAEKEGFSVYMLTPDKDYAQLVSSNIFMMKPRNNGTIECIDKAAICELYNIQNPEQVIDILALWGDKVDNVPGVDGVGEVRAKKLIGEWGSIEKVYAHFDELPKALQPAFEAAREQIPLSKKLVTIDTQVPVPWNEEALIVEKPDMDRLKDLFKEYEFASLMPHLFNFGRDYGLVTEAAPAVKAVTKPTAAAHGQLDLFAPQPETAIEAPETTAYRTLRDVEHSYHIVKTTDDIDRLVALLSTAEHCCFDTETTGVEAMKADLVGLSFCIKAHEAWYVPLPREREQAVALLAKFAPVFNSSKPKIGQNIKYDLLMLKQYGITVNGPLFDTMLMHYLIEPEGRHNMTVLSRAYLNYMPVEIEELIGKKGIKQGSMADVPLENIAEYAAEDADITFQLKEILEKELCDKQLFELYATIEAPLIKVLADMEYEGVKIDAESLTEYGKQLQGELLMLDEEIKQMTGEPTLNISSPKQLGVILFEKLGLAEKAKLTSKTKQYSTDEETLQSIADSHPVIPKILSYRSLRKLLSTYIEALPELINKGTGKIHTTFNQFVTATGRLSSNNPNLQNIPIRDEKGREIRKAFVASDNDHVLLSADYSQIELRIMAHKSNDHNMLGAFCKGEDIHTATAAKIFHISLDKVSKEQRRQAKVANFGIIYGISGFGLAQRLQIPRSEAKLLIDGYFSAYPEVKAYIDKSIADASDQGYVETIFGRIRHLRDIHSSNASVRAFAQRNAVNAPIQGSAADIIKLAMINIHKQLEKNQLQTKMILQVHDELVFDVYLPELEKIKEIVKQEMENVKTLLVPLTVDMGIGKNWLEAH